MSEGVSGIGHDFTAAEFRERTARLQTAMASSELDALLLTTAPDIFYVTGFLTRFWESPTRPWFVIVPAQGEPVAVVPEIGAPLMHTTWLADIRTWPAPQPGDDGVSLLAETLRELTPERARIGLPMGAETTLRMPLADFARVADALKPRSFNDATAVVQRTREIKSEAEIAAIRATCAAAGAAFDRVPEFARAGLSLTAVYRAFQASCLAAGADWVSYLAGGAGHGGYGDVISPATARPLEPGDVLMLDTGAVRDGYFCDFDRNFAIGGASDETRRAYDILFAATEAGIAAARPGVTAAGIHGVIADAIWTAGARPLAGRLGHGLGLSLTEWPSFIPDDATPIRAGMVLAIEPGLELAPGRIMVHEENIVVRETGAELLSPRAPAGIPVIA